MNNKYKPFDLEAAKKDLFMASVKKTGWINIYQTTAAGRMADVGDFVYASKEEADKSASEERISCIEIEWEE